MMLKPAVRVYSHRLVPVTWPPFWTLVEGLPWVPNFRSLLLPRYSPRLAKLNQSLN